MIKKCGPKCLLCGCGRGEGPCTFKEAKLNALRKRGLLTEPKEKTNNKAKRKAVKANRKKGRKR
jgi:hypothetical protein